MGAGTELPTGIVTMLFTDIEGSTRLVQEVGDVYADILERHQILLRKAFRRHRGIEVSETGDGLFFAFLSPDTALAAAADAQDALASEPWPSGVRLRVRMGIHTGDARIRGRTYWGEDVHYAARVADAANGAQVLVSSATATLAGGAQLVDLGEHRLKDFPIPRRLFQLGSGEHPRPRTPDPLRSNLPSSPGDLIGRDAERDALVEMLAAGAVRLVTITGSGGTGKTRLALAVAEELLDELRDGAFFVPLAEVGSAEGVPAAIAAPLGVRLQVDGNPVEAIAAALSGRRLLLVLDNFEHLLDASPIIGALLAAAPKLTVLVTSQAPVRIRGEYVSALGPLDLPLGDDEGSLIASAAGRLLLARADRVELPLSPDEAAALAGLCWTLEGLPLAIELAAARLSLLAPADLLSRIRAGIDALGRGSRDLPARQQGLRAAFEWTHGLLGDDAAALFRRMGVFAGATPLDRIERVCAATEIDVLEALAQLVDLSLVKPSRGGRFYLHAAMRELAREKLAEAGETSDAQRRHAEALAEAAGSWGRRFLLDVPSVQATVAGEEADLGDALIWSAREEADTFARLAGGASMALLLSSRLDGWRELIDSVLARDAVQGEAAAWLLLASSLAGLADEARAQARVAAATELAEATGDPLLAFTMRACSVVVQVLTGPSPGGRAAHIRLREQARELPDPAYATLVEGLDAYVVSYCEGRVDAAEAQFVALLQSPLRTDWAARMAVHCWPDPLTVTDQHEGALRAYAEALRAARERVEPPHMANHLEGMAIALSHLGRHAQAMEAAGWAGSVRQTAGPGLSAWWRELLAGAIETSRAALGPETADAAYARGRALTLDAAVTAGLRLVLSPVPT